MPRLSRIASFFLFPAVIFIIHLAAKGLGLYERFPNVDIPFHYLGGLSIAYTCAQLFAYLESEKLTSASHTGVILLLLFSVTATVAVFWEFAEFLSDQVLNTNLQPSIANTMQDQFLGILGGCTWALVYLKRQLKKQKSL